MKKALGLLFLIIVLFGPVACIAAENHLAINVWGFSHHVSRDKGYNEKNWGLGMRGYHDNWFASIDYMRNSLRGQTTSIGAGYDYPVYSLGKYTFLISAEVAHLNYQVPDRGTARGYVILPGISIRRENMNLNMTLIPPSGKREPIVLYFLTYHFDSW
jgi:hypothetical protein